ncbi:alpha/beta hydrolase [Mycoplasma todarodis]|uniref:alpha/beta hydrolase n=1 Tax=Mycoplasma todarodis TaxID=1937191 RepID=UPI003B2BF6F9
MNEQKTSEKIKSKHIVEPSKRSLLILYTFQILIEIFAVSLTIGLVYSKIDEIPAGVINFIGGIIFAVSATFGLATMISIPVKNTHSYKAQVAAFIMVLICTLGILVSVKSPLYGVISYTTLFILIPFQIGLVLFEHFHWKKMKGLPKGVSLTVFILTIIVAAWMLLTSIIFPILWIFIKRPSLAASKAENITATAKLDKKMGYKPFSKNWDVEPKKSPATFKIDENVTNIYEWAPKADPIKKHDNLVLFVHGLNGTRYTAMRYAQIFYNDIKSKDKSNKVTTEKYKMLSFDMRGFGANRDLHRTYALKEADDLNNAFKAVIKQYSPAHLLIYGISNGAATTISFGTKYQGTIENSKTDVKLIEESGYTSPKAELAAMTDQFKVSHKIVMPQAFPLYRFLTGTYWGERDFLKDINLVKQPLMIIHGGKDFIVPPSMGTNLWNKRQENKSLPTSALFMKKAGHVKIGREYIKEFVAGVNKFVSGQYGKTSI